jgi:hypothetical protein
MLMTFFILLVFFSVPQVYDFIPGSFRMGGFDITWYDLFTGGVFLLWISQLMFTKNPCKGFLLKINKIYFMFLLVGLIPIFIGFINGRSNLLYAYRFFFYFVWVPVIIQLLQKPKRATKALNYLIIINLASVVAALYIHFKEVGFEIFYLTNYYELNLIVSLVLLSSFLAREPLLGKKMDVFIFILCILAFIFDQSRKMQIAFLLGSIILYFNYKKIHKTKVIINKQVLAVILVIIVGVGFMGLWSNVIERLETSFVTPSQIQTGKVEMSAFIRIYSYIGGLNLIKEHPLFGMGAGSPIEIQEWIASGFGINTSLSPHNFYISAMLYYGIPIVLWVYYVIVGLIRWALHEIRNVLASSITKQKIISLGMTAGFIGFMVAMFFEGFEIQTIVDTWLFMGLLLGFANSNKKSVIQENKLLTKQLN